MTDAERARDNTAEAFLAFAAFAPKTRITRTENYCLCTSAFKHSLANFAIRLNLNDDHVEELANRARSSSFFRIHVMTGDSPPTLLGRFEATGLCESHRMKLMAALASGVHDPSIIEVPPQDTRRVAEFMVEQFFWATPPNIRARVTQMTEGMALGASQVTYAIYGESGIEGAATVFYSESAAGLYNVCVRPGSRGRGLGAALVAHACHMASFRSEKVVLQCSPSLAGWYQDLGFREVGEGVALARS